ncbi:MAG: aminopeptidase [Anaerolineae bacterium]|nr:aminopeptidase [Anaerolineae bacterium]
MVDPRIRRLADLLVNYSAAIQPGEWTMIMAEVVALPLAREVYRAVLKAGGHPMMRLFDEELQAINYAIASDEQLTWVSPVERLTTEQLDAMIALRATNNTRAMTNVDPAKMALAASSRNELGALRMKRTAAGEFKWTLTQYPTQASAQEAEMSLTEYEDFIFGATFADRADPVSEWRKISAMQQTKVDWLKGKDRVTVKSANCDLTLSIKDRVFVNSDGRKNMPSGEIFTGPVEDSVNGWVRFTFPAMRSGRAVEGVELQFKDGKVVAASASKNEDFLLSQIDIDAGARYLGEFAIGTNFGITEFTGNTLFDEKIGGTIHMALGRGYPETGSKNESAIHWDMICDMRGGGEIHVDGELFYKDGEFVV